MKKILIISFTDLKKDPRVKRQIRFLKDKYEISTVGLRDAEEKNVTFYSTKLKPTGFISKAKIHLLSKIRIFEKVYWGFYELDSLLNILSGDKFDLIIANDIETLPFALKIANGAKILFDAHEYSPRELEDQFKWRFFWQGYREYLCSKYITHCDSMTTVCKGIADEYYNNFGVKPAVITNACEYINIKPSPVDKKHIKIIHHGVVTPQRKSEVMIEMMNHLDKRFTLDLMFVNTDFNYIKYLKDLAKDNDNIRFLSPIPMDNIVNFISQYDIGLYILPSTSFNCKHSLPNKFFEYIAARLALAIGPSPEMAKIVRQYDLGVLAADFKSETMAKELNKLAKDKIEYYKYQSDKAAYELSSERNCQKLENIVADLIRHDLK